MKKALSIMFFLFITIAMVSSKRDVPISETFNGSIEKQYYKKANEKCWMNTSTWKCTDGGNYGCSPCDPKDDDDRDPED